MRKLSGKIMGIYTTIFFEKGLYQPNKHKLQNLRIRFDVKWDEKKLQENVSYSEIHAVYRLFKSDNRISKDESLKRRKGAIGLWKNDTCALKIIAFDVIDEKDSPPVLLVYKGEENEFYRVLVRMCINIGCEIGKLVEDITGVREIFKYKLSFNEVAKAQSLEKSKCTLKELFDARIKELNKLGYIFNNSFIEEWRKDIDNYGYYSDKMLHKEIERNNTETS